MIIDLRSAVTFEEQDLLGPAPTSGCSSLDDGPFCVPFTSDPDGVGGVSSEGSTLDVMIEPDRSAQFVVDGVLSRRLRQQNEQAFSWSSETYRTFSNLVSKVVGGGAQSEDPQAGWSSKTARSGSQCFRVRFDRFMPSEMYVPKKFSSGIPEEFEMEWDGVWEVDASRPARPTQSRLPAFGTHVVLRTKIGFIHFELPVVVHTLLIGVPRLTRHGADASWGRGCSVCGRLGGQEQWCVSLDTVARNRVPERLDDDTSSDFEYANIGNSIFAVDEIAVIWTPTSGLRVYSLEVMATLRSHPLHDLIPTERRVVLLRRPTRDSQSTAQIEPVLSTVSRDAAIWDMNDVVRQNMMIRQPEVHSAFAASASTAKRETLSFGFRAFPEMLKALKSGLIPPLAGVTFSRLKKEVGVLVESTKEINYLDVLQHSKIESLLDQRLREKNLDGLRALQEAWREYKEHSGGDDHREGVRTAPSSSEADALDSPGSGRSEHLASDAAQSDPNAVQWADAATDAMKRASAKLEELAAEHRQKAKDLKSKEFEMGLEGGKMKVHFVEKSSSLQDIVAHVSKALSASGDGVVKVASSNLDLTSLGEEAGSAESSDGSESSGSQDSSHMDELVRALGLSLAKEPVSDDREASGSQHSAPVQKLLRALSNSASEKQGLDGHDTGTGKETLDMKVHAFSLDEAGNIEGLSSQVAQLLQGMFAEQRPELLRERSGGSDELGEEER
eukprot:TRINITY_DN8545_c0_g1_i1.p1 TRINITY_DN8545_c0_g1~~TRINITY_DN8545_c0_g1_i1.p1  ORF type:complete len:779 (-),score=135.50 TRINITY_DN8545_c0_g1_i1:433-2613(-)